MDTLDTRSEKPADVSAQLDLIRERMPLVYGAIKERAAAIGNLAYTLVRRGLRGEPNCFYAFERGHVVGTPFRHGAITAEAAALMVNFGCAFFCMWQEPPAAKEASDGTA